LYNYYHTPISGYIPMPSGLPPKRTCDHHIPLIPGTKPPNIRPYRMSHSQKDSIMKLIKEMLKNSEIGHSTSPYSSPAIFVRKRINPRDFVWISEA
jgi:hypothetical protein